MKYREIKQVFSSNNVLIYIAMSMLSKDKKNVLPELMYTLDRKDLLKIITVFGGEKIYIPTPAEFQLYMNSAIAFYYFKAKKVYHWSDIQKRLKVDDKEIKKIRDQVIEWSKSCTKEELELLEGLKEEVIDL